MDKYLIVGLGNPGAEYSATRHNIGYMVLDAFAKASNIVFEDRRYGYVAECSVRGRKLFLLKPTTYMNLSGNAVRYWLNKENIDEHRLLVISDDLSLPLGTLRLKARGSAGTHNGMRSIIGCIGTQDFPRIRIGTGDRPAGADLVEWVLGRCEGEERERMEQAFDHAAESALVWVRSGINTAMNTGNRK